MWSLLLALLLPVAAAAPACHVGAYRLSDASVIDIAPGAGDGLRWRRIDGSTGALKRGDDSAWRSTLGWTDRADGHRLALGDCADGSIGFDGLSGTRIALDVRDVGFVGANGTPLAGRLVLPPGDKPVPIVVLVHGSERDSALQWDWMQRLLPAAGVGAFVYDKRGTGDSRGSYTQDFGLLAADAVAAARQARELAGTRAGRIGYRGASQGGWVAPLAASMAPVDFVLVVFGIAVSPLQQDREAVQFQLRAKGYDDAVVAQAWEISDAADAMVAANFSSGIDAFVAARVRHRDAAWYPDLEGNLTQLVLPLSEDALRAMAHIPYPMPAEEVEARGQAYIIGTPWNYDPRPVLRALRTPQLWVVGGQDRDAPAAETLRRLGMLAAAGSPITAVRFADGEHGMSEVRTNAAGERESVGYPAQYLPALLSFARDGTLQGEVCREVVVGHC